MPTFKLSMKPNERVYINGAVIRFDRKTSIEFMNNVHFLLESHVLQADDADTPLKRLYFSIQVQLISPHDTEDSKKLYKELLHQLLITFEDGYVLNELKNIDKLVTEARYHEAMKALRELYPVEQRLLSQDWPEPGQSKPLMQFATG
ncbi:MAG: flagellar biosynthesis repressor FlbT [Rhizobiaceae bacterium]